LTETNKRQARARHFLKKKSAFLDGKPAPNSSICAFRDPVVRQRHSGCASAGTQPLSLFSTRIHNVSVVKHPTQIKIILI